MTEDERFWFWGGALLPSLPAHVVAVKDMNSFLYFYLNLIPCWENSVFLPLPHLITPGYHPALRCRAFWVNPAVLCRPLQARSIHSVHHNRVILSDLEVSTRYCVQVQITTSNHHQSNEKSWPVCESTSNSMDTHTLSRSPRSPAGQSQTCALL